MADDAPPDGPLILVAEDDAEIRALFEMFLHDEGYRVVVAVDGVDALDLAGRERPALILLDLGLPRLNGPDFCRAYRDGGGSAPVVLATAADPAAVAVALKACGAAGYIPKPFDIDEVLQTIAGLVVP
jgi:DNA-binding response OmpR family regulator